MKPNYDEKKSALYALGYISNLTGAITALSNKVGTTITKEQLEANLKASYESNKISYYQYDGVDNPVCVETLTDHCAAFAVDTGYTDAVDGSAILAQYNKTSKGWSGVSFRSEAQILANMLTYRIGALSFRDYASADSFITDLERFLLPGEVWKYAKASENLPRPKTTFQILESYLGVVSKVLVRECLNPKSINKGKVRFSTDNVYATFNTGLLSDKARDVFVVGEVYPKNWNGSGSFQICNPKILKGGLTGLKPYNFPRDVLSTTDMVSFFKNLSDIVYDANIPIDVNDSEKLNHCIDDGIERNRFPEYYKEQWKNGFTDDIVDKFMQAIARAEQIARRNYKYVVPQYRPSKDKDSNIQFLMPIYFTSNYTSAPDFALVLSKDNIDGEPFYRLETVLELSWAYNNARVLCKPDNTWLKPEEIEEADAEEYEV